MSLQVCRYILIGNLFSCLLPEILLPSSRNFSSFFILSCFIISNFLGNLYSYCCISWTVYLFISASLVPNRTVISSVNTNCVHLISYLRQFAFIFILSLTWFILSFLKNLSHFLVYFSSIQLKNIDELLSLIHC